MPKESVAPKISVLMGLYNETQEQIYESIESLRVQTFSDFEVIIVLDNPERNDEFMELIGSINDGRIKTIVNKSNIGLALSMNKAAQLAKSDILARMDSDDISHPDRLRKEYDALTGGDYDFVFSRFDYVDDQCGQLDLEGPRLWSDDELETGILYYYIIHHPTVMMKKQIFEKVGGYRDFPCAQDSDLWFRLLLDKCRFHMIEDKLLKYRVNPNGITQTKRYKQAITNLYINLLLIERMKTGNDSYSKDNYLRFISDYGYDDVGRNESYNYYFKLLEIADKRTFFNGFLIKVRAFLFNKFIRNQYLVNKKKLRLYRKYIQGEK